MLVGYNQLTKCLPLVPTTAMANTMAFVKIVFVSKIIIYFLHFSVLAFVLPASCLAPIDLLQQSDIQQINDNSEENDDLDPYDVNEELMDKGVILDDIGKEKYLGSCQTSTMRLFAKLIHR